MKNKIIVIFSILGVIIFLTVATILIQYGRRIEQNPSGTVGNTAGNLYNSGLFCEDDGYVYFSNPYDNYALYRMAPNETYLEKLIETETCSINAAGKYFYYYQKGSGQGEGLGYVISTTGVYRVEKEDTSQAKCLDRILSDTIVLADNSLYYNTSNQSTGYSLKRITIDGKESEILLDYLITPACVTNSTLYFNNIIDNSHLIGIRLGTTTATELLREDVYMPIVEGNLVYYIDIHDDYSLACYNLTSGEKTTLATDHIDNYNMSDQYIYYQTSGDATQLKRIPKAGGTSEVVADGAYCNINITSQYVYFTKFGADTPVYKTPVNDTISISTFDAAERAAIATLK